MSFANKSQNIIIIITSSFLIGIIYNYFSSTSLPLIREKTEVVYSEIEESETTETQNPNQIKALSFEQVYKVFNEKSAKIVDARDKWDFADGHIPGALNLPEYSFSKDNPLLNELGKNEKLVLYCDGDDCDVSKRLAEELQKIGYTNIYVYLGGWHEWTNLNNPIEKGN